MLSRVNLSISPGYNPRIKTSWIHYFLASYRLGHVTEAARELDISTQALNRNLAALERVVGQELFQRSRGSFILTEAGSRFAAEAQKLLAELDELSAIFLKPDNVTPVELRLGWAGGWENTVLAEILSQTLSSLSFVYPRVQRYVNQSELETAVLNQELALGLSGHLPQTPGLSLIQGQPIPYVIVSAPQSRRHWSQFHYSVLLDQGALGAHPLSWDEARFPRSRTLETDSLDACLEMCRRGLSAACLPLPVVEPLIERRELAIVAEPPEPLYLTPCIFWSGVMPELGQVVLRALRQEVA